MASFRHRQSQTMAPSLVGMPPSTPPSLSSDREGMEDTPQPHLNIYDLRSTAADIKDTLSAAISEDIRVLTDTECKL